MTMKNDNGVNNEIMMINNESNNENENSNENECDEK